MIIYQNSPRQGETLKLVLQFGNGLIGSTVLNSLKRLTEYSATYTTFDWENQPALDQQASKIFQHISNILDSSTDSSIAFVWCAGKVGFAATALDMDDELKSYDVVLNLVKKITASYPECKIIFHHLSSAGGLFENQRLIDSTSLPLPLRFYGQLKLGQEKKLLDSLPVSQTRIYRPTSVYGYTGAKSRMGLIPTLVLNGLQNNTSTIVGNMSTLRDYILNEDIGHYIVRFLFKELATGQSNTFLLASGKPSSISEIKYFVEQSIGKKIYLKFHMTEETANQSDITVNFSSLTPGWAPTDIKSGIRQVKEKIISSM